MTDACRAWTELSDRAAVGDWLSRSELDFMRQHALECGGCRGEAELWSTLGSALGSPALLTAPLAPAPPSLRSRARNLWARKGGAVFSLVALGAAAAALWLVLRAPGVEGSAASGADAPANPSGARVALLSGEVSINGLPPRVGSALAEGDVIRVAEGHACVLLPPGVSACAGSHTVLVVARLEPAARRLGLREGHVVARLARQPAGMTFGVETSAGLALAKGTVFAVETSGKDVWLRVHEGTVLAGRGQGERAFSAPSAGRLAAAPSAEPLSAANSADDARLIELTRVAGEAALAAPRAEVTSSAVPVARAPEHGARDAEPPASASARPTRGGAERAPASARTPAELLAQARDLRREGRFSEAAVTYQRLRGRYPDSAEARVSLVSSGELQLSQLKDARGALSSFDAYLRGGGALAQEARYGRIRALRQLGRLGEERAAIESFLADYPRSVQAAALRARLAERAP